MKQYFLAFFCAIITIQTASAQTFPLNQSTNPIEITADNYLEWNRAAKTFTATGNAKAAQGDVTIESKTLTADYIEGTKKKGMEINEFRATGNVIITSAQNKAYGENAKYNIPKSYAEMTGDNLRLTSPDQTLTANERFEYWVNEGRLIAVNNVKVTRPKTDGSGSDTIESDTMIATLQDKNGKREIETLEAKNNVIITTPTEQITGDYAIYRATPNMVEMTGKIKITRGPNILTGTRATVDLNTNISKIYGGASGTNRVRGVFYPGSEKGETQPQPFTPKKPETPINKTQQAQPVDLIKKSQPTQQPFQSPTQKEDKPSIEILLPPKENTP